MQLGQLRTVAASLGEVVVDPVAWSRVLDDLCRATGSAGACLLHSDRRVTDSPMTASAGEWFDNYVRHGWHQRDIRAIRGVPLSLSGMTVVTDQDILTPEEMQHSAFYNECLFRYDVPWFANIAFRAGSVLWGLSLYRTSRQGSFDRSESETLAQLARRLAETATLSAAVGKAALFGTTNALDRIGSPAIALDRLGRVLAVNASAEALFDEDLRLRNHTLTVTDPLARFELQRLVDHMRTTPEAAPMTVAPILVRRPKRGPVILRILAVDGPARNPFLGARALVVISDLGAAKHPDRAILKAAFALSPAELQVATLIAMGRSVSGTAEAIGIAQETVRRHLKAVFKKTGTRRQGELVSLLARSGV